MDEVQTIAEEPALRVLHEARMISHPTRFKRYAKFLFGDVLLRDACVLDVGGGNGFLSLYVAAMGARQVICLEPESEGSVHYEREAFDALKKRLNVGDRATLLPQGVEEFVQPDTLFDLVILHDSVNHLDERSCVNLLHDPRAANRYVQIMERIGGMMKPGGTFIVTDCSARCLYSDMGVRNPFAPTIEWNKHQTPDLWVTIFQRAGFVAPVVRWTPLLRLGWMGAVLTGNKGVAYCLRAHFRIAMKRKL